MKETPIKLMLLLTLLNQVLLSDMAEDEIEKLRKELVKLVDENVQISIMEVKNPDVDAHLLLRTLLIKLKIEFHLELLKKEQSEML